MTYLDKWDYIYQVLGIKDFIYFISSPVIQDHLFGIKLVFYFFTIFFFAGVMYFYFNSSYLQQQFVQDTTEFFSWQPYGLREINKRWSRIIKKTESGDPAEFKLAIIEADDVLYQILEEMDYDGETFDDVLAAASRKVPNYEDVVYAHAARNSIVYNPDFTIDMEEAKRILAMYESAIKTLSVS